MNEDNDFRLKIAIMKWNTVFKDSLHKLGWGMLADLTKIWGGV